MNKLLFLLFLLPAFQPEVLHRFITPVERQEQRIRDIYKENLVYKVRAMYFNTAEDAASGENSKLHSMQTFDKMGNPIDQRVLTPDKKIRVILMTYDSLGRMNTMSQKTGGKIDHESKLYYDPYGELQLKINTFPSGNIDSVVRNGNYWSGGVKFVLESSAGKVAQTVQEYDSIKHLYKETFVSRDKKIIQASRSTVDDQGYIVKKEYRSTMQNRFDIYHYQYNDFGLMTEEKMLNSQGKLSSVTNFEYDEKGLLQRETINDADGNALRIIKYSYMYYEPPQVLND